MPPQGPGACGAECPPARVQRPQWRVDGLYRRRGRGSQCVDMSTATERGNRSVGAELEREADVIAERFPDVPRAAIADAVREVYHELASTATVRAHLFTITGSVVLNRLRAQGFTYRPRGRYTTAHDADG